MALDFPNSPSDGDVYEGYAWDATTGVWRLRPFADGWLRASGGNSTVDYGGYRYHVFTSSGTLTVATAGGFEALIIGGGGCGGNFNDAVGGGGGGAGGVVVTGGQLASGARSILVGAGGPAPSGASDFNNGEDSSIDGIYIAKGGGFGGTRVYNAGYGEGSGNPGGSGGGGSGNTTAAGWVGAGGASEDGQGYYGSSGGNSTTAENQDGGNGGGAGEPPSGQGSAGIADGRILNDWGVATSTGELSGGNYYYGGGGAGGYRGSNTASNGGLGGGGSNNRTDGTENGDPNTGGGGGGGGNGINGGAGGSGLVIVRYAI